MNKFENGKAILKYVSSEDEEHDEQGVFIVTKSERNLMADGLHKIKIEFIETGMKMYLKKFKRIAQNDLLIGTSPTVNI